MALLVLGAVAALGAGAYAVYLNSQLLQKRVREVRADELEALTEAQFLAKCLQWWEYRISEVHMNLEWYAGAREYPLTTYRSRVRWLLVELQIDWAVEHDMAAFALITFRCGVDAKRLCDMYRVMRALIRQNILNIPMTIRIRGRDVFAPIIRGIALFMGVHFIQPVPLLMLREYIQEYGIDAVCWYALTASCPRYLDDGAGNVYDVLRMVELYGRHAYFNRRIGQHNTVTRVEMSDGSIHELRWTRLRHEMMHRHGWPLISLYDERLCVFLLAVEQCGWVDAFVVVDMLEMVNLCDLGWSGEYIGCD